jgi:hypothetical protein
MVSRVLLALALAVLVLPVPAAQGQSQSGFEYNGMVHVSWWFDEYDGPQSGPSRAALASTGTNWMGLLVTWYQDNAQSNVIARHPDPNKDHTDARIRAAIRDARARGMQVMVKPHVDAHNGQWRGDFNPSNPDAWFQSYTQFIVHYAQIAEEENAEGFVMGTEFKTITSNRANDARWTAVIAAVRNAYSGLVTYAANATFPADEFASVGFWDQMDVIGLDAYFNLTNLNNPTVAQLIAAWTNNRNGEDSVAVVRNLSTSRGKPVIFTELGYKSTDRTNVEPWNFGLSGAVDPGEQRDCYEAAFTVWSQQSSWMRGVFWWNWTVPPPPANDGDYNPRGKPAEQVLRTWQGPSGPNFTLSPNPASVSVTQGSSATSTINIARSGGFTGAVSLSASGLPPGVTPSFNPASTSGTSSLLTFTATGAAAAGTATVTITGTGGGLTRTATVSLTVSPGPSFTLTPNPASVSVTRGASATSTIGIARSGGFTGAVSLSASGLPTGVAHGFTPASATGASSVLTFTANASAVLGTSTVTITGTGAGLTRTTTISLTVNAAQTPNVTLSATPASVSVTRSASAQSTISLARSGGFTGAVALSVTGLPAGVTAAFNPGSVTGASSVLTFTATATATVGAANVTVTGTGGGLTRTTTVSLTVIQGGGGGAVTATPVINANGPWFNENGVRFSNTATLTALTVTIVVQRTPGVSFSGIYNTVGGQIQQSNSSTTAAVTYTWTLAPGQTLGMGTGRLFAGQSSGTGTPHPTSGDTWSVTFSTGGTATTQSGAFP